ncbi:MAG: CDP-archaeol synthase [Gammaproteobacteria bacterium]|nr:CDP-archaeol synthase [Gammaproteobacteria bacterium]
MRLWLVHQLLLLLVITNATPVIISLLAGRHWNWPLDGNCLFRDQRPLLGPSKTVRGILGAVLVTALIAPLFSLTAIEGASFALLAMTGDLCSSFIKRRLGIASSRSVPLLDQLPETVLPLWTLQTVLGADVNEMVLAVALFTVIDLLLSRLIRPATAR